MKEHSIYCPATPYCCSPPSRPEWIHSKGVYLEPKTGGEVKISGFYNNKQTNKKLKIDDDVSTIPPNPVRESIWSRFSFDLLVEAAFFELPNRSLGNPSQASGTSKRTIGRPKVNSLIISH